MLGTLAQRSGRGNVEYDYIQVYSSKHWKISKGGVTFAEIKDPVPEAIPAKVDITPSSSKEPLPGASEGEIESVKEKSPVKEKRRKSYNFRRHCFTLYHSEYERHFNLFDTSVLIMRG